MKRIFNEATSFIREPPDFLIIGTSYCGKTLLYNYLTQHPLICKNLREETGFFVSNYKKGACWYKSNFPSTVYKKFVYLKYGQQPLVGETVNLPGTLVPERIVKTIPKVKLIAVIRNPSERAYVRYLAMIREGLETRTFEEALDWESNDMVKHETELLSDKIWPPLSKNYPLYKLSGIYATYFERWSQFFSLKEILILKSEDLFSQTLDTVNKALEFLGLTKLKSINQTENFYEKNDPPIDTAIKRKLDLYFQPHNERLFALIGKNLGWNDL